MNNPDVTEQTKDAASRLLRVVSWLKDILEIGWTEPDTQSLTDPPCPRCEASWPIWVQRNWQDGRKKRKCRSCGFRWHESANNGTQRHGIAETTTATKADMPGSLE